MRRTELVEHVAEFAGREGIELHDLGNGWPALATVRFPRDIVRRVAVYPSAVGLSQRGRDAVERRIQVKGGHPMEDDGRYAPLLLGVWLDDELVAVERPVLLLADARRRIGHTTQVSVFVPLVHLQEAARRGWSTYVSSTNEIITCFVPELLPTAVAAREADVVLDSDALQAIAAASGLVGEEVATQTERERARAATTRLVRDARFARSVGEAYGRRCAMCGLGLGIVEAAHIVPVGAAADDNIRNGLALCPNHHRMFDRHLVGVHPSTREIIFHPRVHTAAHQDREVAGFVESTLPQLREALRGAGPAPQSFLARYEYFVGRYEWLTG